MKNYYFLASALPPLYLKEPPEINMATLEPLLLDNLSKKDYEKVSLLRLYDDIENIRRLWSGEPLAPYGNLDENELADSLVARRGLPTYIYAFLDRFDTLDKRLEYFPSLIADYFHHLSQEADGFLRWAATFESELRLVFVGFRAKVLQRDMLKELQFEDPQNEMVAQILAQKDSPSFEPPEKYQELKPFFEEYRADPLGLYQFLLAYRFQKIEEWIGTDLFSIDFILSYVARFILLEKWFDLDKQRGIQFIQNIAKGKS